MEKKLTKTKYVDFMHHLTGHSKSFIKNNMNTKDTTLVDSFTFIAGTLSYYTWIISGRIYTQCFLDNHCQCAWYHDFNTFEYDWKFTEEQNN